MRIVGKSLIAAAVAVASLGTSMSAQAQDKLRVIVFPGMSNLPQFAAEAQGYYKKRDLQVELINTPNSTELRKGLAAGRYDIAHGGVDNAVAQVEDDKTDLFIFMGGNSGMNSLFVQPEINSYDDLRGKIMAVDLAAHGVRAPALQDAGGEGREAERIRGEGRRRDASAPSGRC